MKFQEIQIENFLALSEAKVRLADRGLILIQGVNEDDPSADSNGAGKSSIADALSWALYGVTARGVTGDAVVNRDAGRDCLVRLTFNDGEDVYQIVRARKHKTMKNALQFLKLEPSGDILDLTEGTEKLTQEKLERILGCSHEVFKAAVYAGQEQMPDLPAMTDKHLKVLVEEAAGITVLERAYEVARIRLARVKGDRDAAQATLDKAVRRKEVLEQQLADLTAAGDDFEKKRAETIEDFKTDITIRQANIKELETQLAEYDVPALERQLADLQAKLDAVKGEQEEERRLAAELSAAEKKEAALRGNAARTKTDAEMRKSALDRIGEKVGQPCGECGKPYCEHDLAEAKRLATAKLRNTVEQFKREKSALDDAIAACQTLADTLEAHRASMTDVSATSDQQRKFRASLTTAKAVENQITDQKQEIARIEAMIATKRDEPNPQKRLIDGLGAKIAAADEEIGAARGALTATEVELELTEAAAKVYSPAGVRAHILDTVTPFLNDRTAAYLGTLSDGRISAVWQTLSKTAKGDLKEKFCIDVTHDCGGENFAALSGGEKRKVRIACALALQDLVASRASKPIDLFLGDEIDDALDSAGLERLMAVLVEKAKERGSVLVISHNDLRDWIDNIITVRKNGGAALVEDAA